MESTTNGTSIIENKHVNHLYIVDALEMGIGKYHEITNLKYSVLTIFNELRLLFLTTLFSIILDF